METTTAAITPQYLLSCKDDEIDGKVIAGFATDAEAVAFAAEYGAICTRINADGSRVTFLEPKTHPAPGFDLIHASKGKEWGDLTPAEKEAIDRLFEHTPGGIEYAVMHVNVPLTDLTITLRTLEAIRADIETIAAPEGLRNDFDLAGTPELLQFLRRRLSATAGPRPDSITQ